MYTRTCGHASHVATSHTLATKKTCEVDSEGDMYMAPV